MNYKSNGEVIFIMENKIVIQNFGPVKEAQINLNKNFQIFIGAQASGKSTICKVVYFVQKIRDYTLLVS